MDSFGKRLAIVLGLMIIYSNAFSQGKQGYQDAYNEINQMLKGQKPLNFKRAVFISENAYHNNTLNYKNFCSQIDQIVVKLNQYIDEKGVRKNNMRGQFAAFNYMMEPSPYNDYTKYTYDFDDLMGDNDWTKMFVTKLLRTKSGNCNSLPYLYKILNDELGSKVYLALGPNHLYIKHKDNDNHWVNVELTNGSFPTDAWVISSLSINTDAIKSEIYMKPLTQKESVALCLFDLAEAYKFQYGLDDFVLQLCNTLIANFPKCIMAYMIKSDVYVKQREDLMKQTHNKRTKSVMELEKLAKEQYKIEDDLGYQAEPAAHYEQWQQDVEKEKERQKQAKLK